MLPDIVEIDKLNLANPKTHDNIIGANDDIEAITIWLKEFIQSKNTFIAYRQVAERFFMWLKFNNQNLNDVTREIIQGYSIFLENPSPSEYWCGVAVSRTNPNWKPFVKGLSDKSISFNLQILKSMYDYLVDSGYLSRNPFRLVRHKARLEPKEMPIERYLTSAELNLILDYIEKMPLDNEIQKLEYARTKWIFKLLYLTGCRRSEVCNAKMSDFIFKRNQWWLRVIGKGNKYGEIPVTNELINSLVEYRIANGLDSYPTSNESNIGIILSNRNIRFTSITDSMLYKIIKKICNKVASELKLTDAASAYKFEKISTHWMRHTSATHQVDSGIDIRIVKKNLRHSQLETTMKYQHTDADNQYNETADKFKIIK